MTTFDDLIKAKKAAKARPSGKKPAGAPNRADVWKLPPEERGTSDTMRALGTGGLQGLTFGYSEEMGGLAKDAGNWLGLTDDTGEAYKARQRAEQARLSQSNPGAYLTGEIAGALAPTLIPGVGALAGPARAVQAENMLARGAMAVARPAAYGAVDAGLQASGRAEGFGPRIGAAIEAAPTGALLGAGGNVVLGTMLKPFVNKAAAKLGRTTATAVERNIREIAAQSGMSTDDVVARISAGESLAGMNDTTRMVARAIKNESPGAGTAMIKATGERLDTAVGQTVQDARTALVGPRLAREPNLRAAATEGMKTARSTVGTALDDARIAAGAVGDQGTVDAMLDAVGRTPQMADKLNTALRANGMPPLFKKTPTGMEMLRTPTIREAEMLTSELNDYAHLAYTGGGLVSTTTAKGVSEAGTTLRAAVDDEAKALGPLRTAYSNMAEAEDVGFPLGFKARSTSPDELALGFGKLSDPAKDAARLGAATKIGEDVGKARRDTSLIDEMLDPGRYLGRNIDEMAINPMDRTAGARAKSEARLLDALAGNSTTEGQRAAGARLKGETGSGPIMPTVARIATMVDDALRLFVANERGLNDDGLRALGQQLMASGPQGAAAIKEILDRSRIMGGDTASLERLLTGAAGAAAASPTNPSGAVTNSGGLLDMMFGRDAYGRPLPQPEP